MSDARAGARHYYLSIAPEINQIDYTALPSHFLDFKHTQCVCVCDRPEAHYTYYRR